MAYWLKYEKVKSNKTGYTVYNRDKVKTGYTVYNRDKVKTKNINIDVGKTDQNIEQNYDI